MPFNGFKHSEETRQKISKTLKGRMPSNLEQLRSYHKIKTPEQEKKRLDALRKKLKGRHFTHSEETKKKIREKRKLQVITEETKRKIGLALKGGKRSQEARERMSQATKGIPRPQIRGERSPHWQGGITPLNKAIRNSLEYRLWRESVFKRDNWTCRFCLTRGGELQADHIKPFALFPELRLAIDNGRTLCAKCHKTTDTFAGKFKRINKEI